MVKFMSNPSISPETVPYSANIEQNQGCKKPVLEEQSRRSKQERFAGNTINQMAASHCIARLAKFNQGRFVYDVKNFHVTASHISQISAPNKLEGTETSLDMEDTIFYRTV